VDRVGTFTEYIYTPNAARTLTLKNSFTPGDVLIIHNAYAVTSTNNFFITINANDGTLIGYLRTGYCRLVVKHSSVPTTNTHWQVAEIVDTATYTGSATGAGTGATYSLVFLRNNNRVTIGGNMTTGSSGTPGNSIIASAVTPTYLYPGNLKTSVSGLITTSDIIHFTIIRSANGNVEILNRSFTTSIGSPALGNSVTVEAGITYLIGG
jgi:hypothetical protein